MAKRQKKRPQKKSLLAHHRHTGKVLQHHHTSYPFIALLLLMLGVLLMYMTFQVSAADVGVTATSNGPLPPSPAIILNPSTGDHFSAIPITVSGTCPTPYLVKIFRNQVFSGSAQCAPDGTFVIQTDLFEGANELEARIYNYADQEGPTSPSVTVTYASPGNSNILPENPSEQQSIEEGTIESPFFIATDKFFKANLDMQRMDWTFNIIGGTQPFDIKVDWGDGGSSKLENLLGNTFSVSHVYAKSSETREYYPMQVKAASSDERIATLQVFNILNYTDSIGGNIGGSLPTGGTSFPKETAIEKLQEHLKYAWPAYSAITLMAISFWLGQHTIFVHAVGHSWAHKFKLPKNLWH